MARTLTAAGPDRANRMIFLGAVGLALIAAVLVYFVAKVLERFDGRIYDALGHAISGHALKHLVAAGACWCLVRMAR